MKLDLLTNAIVVDDAIGFVSQKSKEKLMKMRKKNQTSLNMEKMKIS